MIDASLLPLTYRHHAGAPNPNSELQLQLSFSLSFFLSLCLHSNRHAIYRASDKECLPHRQLQLQLQVRPQLAADLYDALWRIQPYLWWHLPRRVLSVWFIATSSRVELRFDSDSQQIGANRRRTNKIRNWNRNCASLWSLQSIRRGTKQTYSYRLIDRSVVRMGYCLAVT